MKTLEEQIEELFPELVQIRRDFHRHPELGEAEFRTGQKICEYLDEWGIRYKYPVADTGIVAVLTGKVDGQGNTVGLRADMDALPVTEASQCSAPSKTPGVMHACGHDAHMAIQLGAARILKAREHEWAGCVKLFFQPAEETVGGAGRMVKAGCMEQPHVDYVTGLHMTPSYPAGHVELKHGKLNASSDMLDITIHGAGCHGAYPEGGVDAVVIAASLINSLQTLISRSISPLDSAVLTFGTIRGGTARNIIADSVVLTGTLRTLDKKTRALALETIKRQLTHICTAYGGSGELELLPGYAALINTEEVVDILVGTAEELLGSECIHWKEAPSMGVEDFSEFLEKAPGVFYHLGCANPETGIAAPLHSGQFDIDEKCLKTGVLLQVALTEKLLCSAALK